MMGFPELPTENEIRRLFPNISASCLRKTLAMGGVAVPERKQGPPPALDSKPSRRKTGSRHAGVVVSLISVRRRELDDDNLVAGFKPLRDAIAQKLGIDDADKRIRWQYGQQITTAEKGTIVLIERK